jgi:hypothetical protein
VLVLTTSSFRIDDVHRLFQCSDFIFECFEICRDRKKHNQKLALKRIVLLHVGKLLNEDLKRNRNTKQQRRLLITSQFALIVIDQQDDVN